MTKKEIIDMHNETNGFKPTEKFQKEWITKGISQEGVKFTSKLGFILCDYGKYRDKKTGKEEYLNRPGKNALSTSQIRNVYGEAKRIQMKGFANEKTKFLLLKPKMAYATSRHKSLQTLTDVLNLAFEEVDTQNDERGELTYNNFMDFFEAILAYHKSYGGKD